MKVVFGCDPNATQFKLDLMEYVKSLGHEVTQKYASFVICIRRHSQVVRQRSAKPLFPSSNLGGASNKEDAAA